MPALDRMKDLTVDVRRRSISSFCPCAALPVYPNKQRSSEPAGMSQTCHKEPSAYRRYRLDSSRASFQIPAISLYAQVVPVWLINSVLDEFDGAKG